MVNAIEFAVRNVAGGTQHGNVAGDTQGNFIQVGSGDSISLNLSQASVVGYEQQGQDLVVKLVDGRTVVLSNYFNEAAGEVNHLYLSSDGEITEVLVHGGQDGVLASNYGPVSGWDKWSPLDDMRFTQADGLADVAMVSNEPAGMGVFAPGLIGGGLGGLGAVGAGAAALAVLGGSGGGGGTKDTTPPAVAVNQGTKSVNHVENGDDYTNGVTLGGTGEVGAKIDVLVNGHTQTTTVGPDGKWVVTFPTSQVEPGEYEIPVKVTATDAAGNASVANDVLVMDTKTSVAFVGEPGGADHVVNLAESAAGVLLNGTAEAGASVSVVWNGITRTTTADASGNWSVTYEASVVTHGTYNSTATVTSTDIHGNTATATQMVHIDTENAVAIDLGQVGTDNVVSGAEANAGIALTGTGEAGASVVVTFKGVSHTVIVGADNKWVANFASSEIERGTYDSVVTVTSTDAAGNVATASHNLHVDTEVAVAVNAGQAGGDDWVNKAEQPSGLALTGTAEAGSRVTLVFENMTRVVTADAQGKWVVNFAANEVRGGTYDSTVSVTAMDAVGNTATTTHLLHVDTEINVAIPSRQVGGDDKVSGAEHASGLVLNGTADAGARVEVTLQNVTRIVTADANGKWSANFATSEVAAGTYDTTVTVKATDAAGNSATASHNLHVDTETNVAINNGQSGGDDWINGAEANAAAGVALTGTAEAGDTVVVTMGAFSHTVVANASGVWVANFASGEITKGTYDTTVTAVATDAMGNSASSNHLVHIDTEVNPFDRATLSLGSDAILNKVEALNGLTVTGHVEAGSTVMVKFGDGSLHEARVELNGDWSYTFLASEIPAGDQHMVNLTAIATDHVGNVSTISEQVAVDTLVSNFTHVDVIAGDDKLNAIERAAGLTLSGTSEPNSDLVVKLANNNEMRVHVGSDGNWSVTFPADKLPTGEGDMGVTVTATDHAGNVAQYTDSFHYDTVVPADPWITNDSGSGNVITGIATAISTDAVTYHAVALTGAATDVTVQSSFDPTFNVDGQPVPSHMAYFNNPVADGSYLVINSSDAAGNEQATLYLRGTTGDVTVRLDREGLAEFDFGTIDLSAAHATVSITEAQIMSLTGADHQMAIKGGIDDHVNVAGAVAGGHEVVNGQSYTLYTLGSNGASLLIDDDVIVNTTV
jgi:large repetitive protein